MKTLSLSGARRSFFPIVRKIRRSGPVEVLGKDCDAVIMDADEYRALVESLHIASTPGLLTKIRKAERSPRSAWTRVR